MNSTKLTDILAKESISQRAKEDWDSKDVATRNKRGQRYAHFYNGDWSMPFDKLTIQQQKLLKKGELIRTYDSLSNIDKTYLKRRLGLTCFASKWFRLNANDKKTILKFVI